MIKKLIPLMSLALLGTIAVHAGTETNTPPTVTQQVTPGTISYQGRLQDADGNNYTNGIYTLDFKLYDGAGSTANLLWGATYKPYVNNGFFSVILGQTNVGEAKTSDSPLDVADFWKGIWIDPSSGNTDRYLGITVSENEANVDVLNTEESYPRQQLLASPFAIQAQFAQQAETAQTANGSVGDFEIGGELNVKGDTTLGQNIYTAGPWLDIHSLVHMYTDTYINGFLKVGGDIDSFGDSINLNSKLNITDDATVGGDLTVTGSDITGGSGKSLTLNSKTDYIDAMQTVAFKAGIRLGDHEMGNVMQAPDSFMGVVGGRVSRGNSSGSGTGFSYARTDTGIYTVTLSGLASITSVTATCEGISTAHNNFIVVDDIIKNTFRVLTMNEGETYENTSFSFIAVVTYAQ